MTCNKHNLHQYHRGIKYDFWMGLFNNFLNLSNLIWVFWFHDSCVNECNHEELLASIIQSKDLWVKKGWRPQFVWSLYKLITAQSLFLTGVWWNCGNRNQDFSGSLGDLIGHIPVVRQQQQQKKACKWDSLHCEFSCIKIRYYFLTEVIIKYVSSYLITNWCVTNNQNEPWYNNP